MEGKERNWGRKRRMEGKQGIGYCRVSLPLYSAESFSLGFRLDHDQAETMYSRNTASLATIQGVQEKLQFTTAWKNET